TNNDNLLNLLRTLRRRYRLAIKEAKRQSNEDYIENSVNKCRAAWTIINKASGKETLRSRSSNILPDEFNSHCVTAIEEISAKVKSSVNSANQCLNKLLPPFEECVFCPVTVDDVRKIVLSLKNSHSKDVYGLSSILIKAVIDYIIEPLTYSINCCVLEGIFPTCLKFSKVVPVYKNGSLDCPNNYRPISCVPILSKVIEKLLKHQICIHFENLKLFSSSQFGYRTDCSTVKAVNTLVNNVLLALENNCWAQITLCDLSKAFDCVRPDILVNKLEFYGFRAKNLNM
ncbi:hypothetical protein J6590_041524, partial [Homalodisca vitripennis]